MASYSSIYASKFENSNAFEPSTNPTTDKPAHVSVDTRPHTHSEPLVSPSTEPPEATLPENDAGLATSLTNVQRNLSDMAFDDLAMQSEFVTQIGKLFFNTLQTNNPTIPVSRKLCQATMSMDLSANDKNAFIRHTMRCCAKASRLNPNLDKTEVIKEWCQGLHATPIGEWPDLFDAGADLSSQFAMIVMCSLMHIPSNHTHCTHRAHCAHHATQ